MYMPLPAPPIIIVQGVEKEPLELQCLVANLSPTLAPRSINVATQYLYGPRTPLQGVEKEPLELQCLVANLIFRKYVKGYLAFKSRVLVLAKTDAFPQLSAVQLSDPFAG